MLQTTTISYVGSPTIPVGMTIEDYRRSRPHRRSRLMRVRTYVRALG
jgi:hypothetical protein